MWKNSIKSKISDRFAVLEDSDNVCISWATESITENIKLSAIVLSHYRLKQREPWFEEE
jgi:hypothetical protein